LVADGWQSDDVSAPGGFIGEGFPQQENALRQIGFFHEGVGPDGLHQFFFGDHIAASANQDQKHLKGFLGQRNQLAVSPELAAPGVDLVFSELV
jgi:hypothetical protein